MASKKANSSNNIPRSKITTQRLSREEETRLLQQASEYSRLLSVEKDLALKSIMNELPILSVRAEAAGYGSDLGAYEEALENGQIARESLVTSNIGLVHFCVKDIVGKRKLNSLSKEDLIQEGSIGLARAIDKYNPNMGSKFSTYAVYWIRAAVLRCIAERDDLLRVPEHVSQSISKLTKAAQALGVDLDDQEILATFASNTNAWEEAEAAKALAVKAGLTDKQLAQAMRVKARRRYGGYTSFESWMQTKDMVDDVATISAVEESESSDMGDLKSTLSPFLRPKEMEALSWRYGLKQPENPKPFRDYLAEAEDEIFGPEGILSSSSVVRQKKTPPQQGRWGEAMSFTEVGKHMSISAEYGRRLCQAALKKLRAAAEEGKLEPALLG